MRLEGRGTPGVRITGIIIPVSVRRDRDIGTAHPGQPRLDHEEDALNRNRQTLCFPSLGFKALETDGLLF